MNALARLVLSLVALSAVPLAAGCGRPDATADAPVTTLVSTGTEFTSYANHMIYVHWRSYQGVEPGGYVTRLMVGAMIDEQGRFSVRLPDPTFLWEGENYTFDTWAFVDIDNDGECDPLMDQIFVIGGNGNLFGQPIPLTTAFPRTTCDFDPDPAFP